MSSWIILAYSQSILKTLSDRGREIMKIKLCVAHSTAAEGFLYVPTQSVKYMMLIALLISRWADVPSFFVSSVDYLLPISTRVSCKKYKRHTLTFTHQC